MTMSRLVSRGMGCTGPTSRTASWKHVMVLFMTLPLALNSLWMVCSMTSSETPCSAFLKKMCMTSLTSSVVGFLARSFPSRLKMHSHASFPGATLGYPRLSSSLLRSLSTVVLFGLCPGLMEYMVSSVSSMTLGSMYLHMPTAAASYRRAFSMSLFCMRTPPSLISPRLTFLNFLYAHMRSEYETHGLPVFHVFGSKDLCMLMALALTHRKRRQVSLLSLVPSRVGLKGENDFIYFLYVCINTE